MEKRQAIWIFAGAQGRLMHQATNRKVRHQQAVELLANQFRRLAPQYDLGPAQMGLQLIQGRLDLPALVVERGQFLGGRPFVIQDGGLPSVSWLASNSTVCCRLAAA